MSQHLRWPTKEPGSTRTYALDVTDDIVNTIIQQVAVAVKPSGTGEMAVNGLMVSGEVVELSLTGGVAGRSYLIQIDITPYGAFPIEYLCWIYIDRTKAVWPILNPINEGFGAPILWTYSPSLDFSKKQNSWTLMMM